MPELPEVETTRAGVEPHVAGQRVRTVLVRQPRLRWPVSDALARELPGQTIHAVRRRAKYLLFAADSGHVCLHLGMSGRLRVAPYALPRKLNWTSTGLRHRGLQVRILHAGPTLSPHSFARAHACSGTRRLDADGSTHAATESAARPCRARG